MKLNFFYPLVTIIKLIWILEIFDRLVDFIENILCEHMNIWLNIWWNLLFSWIENLLFQINLSCNFPSFLITNFKSHIYLILLNLSIILINLNSKVFVNLALSYTPWEKHLSKFRVDGFSNSNSLLCLFPSNLE